MKIDFIVSSLIGGGAERVLVLLAAHLLQKGHSVSIITFNKGEDFEIDPGIQRIRLHDGGIKNHTLRSLNNLFKYYKVKINRPEIAISFITATNLIAIVVAKYFKIPIICSEHINHLQKGNYITKFTRSIAYRFADRVTVLTTFDKPYYEKKGIKVTVMPNPCTFSPIKTYNPKRDKILLAIGNLDRYYHKGFDNLIQLIHPVLKSNKDWKLKIIGSGDDGMQFLKKKVEQLLMTDQIIFTGFQSDINSILTKSQIFILSSRFEGLPMVLLEAMSQGVTCIAFDCVSGPSDIIQQGENGLLIENQNQNAMADGIGTLINNKELRTTLAQNAITSIDQYHIDRIITKWEDLFNVLKI
ncbi:glycosyltransferase family 4 protein [Arenibacter sp. 6A1]|uniref:glycosyltransferase family 4 protein n=1 Tax=Arenibacter sp. 6A1 TaxID=2720391 RepID=UPI001445FDF8|nr:glycosyltransferase family 4 protein [Arenibacter sp. 6A1]NKI27113.1 glycosyltransferase family 4 protein [Arenibacter sp. 6A1]